MKRIEDYLKYDETSKTCLRWITRYGNEAFTFVFNNRYYRGSFNYKSIFAHQVIMYLFYGKWSSKELHIDHMDGNSLNNKIDNLRFVTPIENQRNLNNKVPKNNTTGIRGLGITNNNGKRVWRARLFGKELYKGHNKEIAIKRLEKAKRDYLYSKQENQLKLEL
jgi:hypothetical protein